MAAVRPKFEKLLVKIENNAEIPVYHGPKTIDGCYSYNIEDLSDKFKYKENLDLRNKNLSAEELQELFLALQGNTTIVSLDLSHNTIDAKTADLLSRMLQENNTIVELSLSRCKLDEDGIIAIAEAIENNRTLEKLYLSYNEISREAIRVLANSIANNQTLRMLHIIDCGIKQAGMIELVNCLQINNSLQVCAISGNEINDAIIFNIAEKARGGFLPLVFYIDSKHNISEYALAQLIDVVINNGIRTVRTHDWSCDIYHSAIRGLYYSSLYIEDQRAGNDDILNDLINRATQIYRELVIYDYRRQLRGDNLVGFTSTDIYRACNLAAPEQGIKIISDYVRLGLDKRIRALSNELTQILETQSVVAAPVPRSRPRP